MEGCDNEVSSSVVNLVYDFESLCSNWRIVYIKSLAYLVYDFGSLCSSWRIVYVKSLAYLVWVLGLAI
jgi:hypothetical protein